MFSDIKVGLGWMEPDDLPWVHSNENWHDPTDVGQAFASRNGVGTATSNCPKPLLVTKANGCNDTPSPSRKDCPVKKIRTLMHQQETDKARAEATSGFLAKPM